MSGYRLRGMASREHLVEENAEREDVGARIDGLALCLLGRHVGRRPGKVSFTRFGDGGSLALHQGSHWFRETEVEHFDPPILGHHDVVGLQIPVNDALGVRGRHRVRKWDGELEETTWRKRALRQNV